MKESRPRAAGGHTAIERTAPIIDSGNAFSVSLASVPDAVAAVFGHSFIRASSGPHTGQEERASLCRYFGGMNEPGTRIRVRSMNHSACTVDVDAERERDTQTHRVKGKESERGRSSTRDERCSSTKPVAEGEREKERKREREREEGRGAELLVGGSRTGGRVRGGWMHPLWCMYGGSSPVAGVEYAGAGVLKSGGGCGRVPITRRG